MSEVTVTSLTECTTSLITERANRATADSNSGVTANGAFNAAESSTGLFSFIKLGRQKSSGNNFNITTSSPTIDHPSGHYVWDFLNWGFTSPYCLEQFSRVKAKEQDLVPYSSMDQGRLFVRVSVQDLSTLQLAYQRGLAALQKAQAKVEKLADENHRLQSMVKSWTIKTTALTTESIELRQEISNIKQKMRNCSVPVEDYKELIKLLCSKICRIFDKSEALPNAGLTFDELVRIVFSLPPLIQGKLMEACPCFNDFIDSKDSGLFIRMQMDDARKTIQRILDLLPLDVEQTVLKSIVKDFHKKHEGLASQEIREEFDLSVRQRCNTDPMNYRLMPVKMTISQSREDNTDIAYTDVRRSSESYLEPPELPPRNYSPIDLLSQQFIQDIDSVTIQGSSLSIHEQVPDRCPGSVTVEPTATSSQHASNTRHNYNEEDNSVIVRMRKKNSVENNSTTPSDRSLTSSSIGIPLASSTPCGTMSRLVDPRHQINPPVTPRKHHKRKKKKISRWNIAARICSSRKSSTISDSESFDATVYSNTRQNARINNNNFI